MFKIFIILVLIGTINGNTKTSNKLSNQSPKERSYEHDINRSLQQDKVDKQLLTTWAEEFQLKQVNLMAEYRIQMMKHRDHNFRTNISEKWEDCIHTYKRTINRMENDYTDEESLCVRTALTASQEKKQDIIQIEKEKRKWRKGYKYVENLCKSNYNTNQEIASCIVKYVENDNYNLTLQRLIALKIKLMGELFVQYNTIIFDLGECLRINLYTYLYNVRAIMKVMQRCYYGRKN